MKLEDKLARNATKQHTDSHIQLDAETCQRCQSRVCLVACPGQLYTVEESSGQIIVDHSGCLECGTCLIVCPQNAVTWQYPEAGYGICYRYG
jgi:ferredoxin like protein